jgi:hypothetical protein
MHFMGYLRFTTGKYEVVTKAAIEKISASHVSQAGSTADAFSTAKP